MPTGPYLRELGKYIFPFTKPSSDRDQPFVGGSGVLVSTGEAIYIVSAKHVFDDDGNTIYMPNFVPLEVDSTRAVEVADPIDLTVFKLTPEQAAGFAAMNIEPVPTRLWDVDDAPEPQRRYVFTGFPATRARVSRPRQTISPRGVSANCIPAPEAELIAAGFNPHTHIGVRFDRDRMADERGSQIIAPDPEGMSGGAVWTQSSSEGYKLVGIGIRHFRDRTLMVATRIGAVSAILHAGFPESRPFVRLSSRCRYIINS